MVQPASAEAKIVATPQAQRDLSAAAGQPVPGVTGPTGSTVPTGSGGTVGLTRAEIRAGAAAPKVGPYLRDMDKRIIGQAQARPETTMVLEEPGMAKSQGLVGSYEPGSNEIWYDPTRLPGTVQNTLPHELLPVPS